MVWSFNRGDGSTFDEIDREDADTVDLFFGMLDDADELTGTFGTEC